ncbi:MAG TPA: hypothetical protein VIW67_22265 [Terriglobales bacterium]|jgi:hypothetical protein
MLLLPLPLLLSGCLTGNTIYMATHEHTRYLHEEVSRVEKAVCTQDAHLIVLLEGKVAGSSRKGPYTVTVFLPQSPAHGSVSAPRSSITEGWEPGLLERTDLLAVAVGPRVTLPGHQRTQNKLHDFPGLEGAARTLYLVENAAHDLNLEMVYVASDDKPEKLLVHVQTKKVSHPHNYPLLFWLPLTIPLDATTLPFQLLLYPLFSSIRC